MVPYFIQWLSSIIITTCSKAQHLSVWASINLVGYYSFKGMFDIYYVQSFQISDKAIPLSATLLFFLRIILAIPADFSLSILSLELDLSNYVRISNEIFVNTLLNL